MLDAREVVEAFALRNWSVRGDELTASCPFSENHPNGDKNPSFGVNLAHGVYHCFSCGESGTVEQLAERVLGMSRSDAVLLVYGRLGGSLVHGGERSDVVRHERSHVLCDTGAWVGDPTGYWKSRGIAQATVGEWGLGYDPASERVVIPVSVDGSVIGWTKRRTREDVEPKWVHSPGLDRANILFGLDRAEGDTCILVEAPLSAVMLWQQGWRCGVASFGCSLSQGQADLIRRRFREVVIDYDPDDAGRGGVARAVSMLSMFMSCKVVTVAVDDPAAQTREQNLESIESAVPWWAATKVYNNTVGARSERKGPKWRSSRLGAGR